jgi:hypothetical protein
MKTKLTILLGLTIIVVTAYATIIGPPYDKSRPPGMSLPVAYEHAVVALGSETNQFHCISAEVSNNFFSEGEWYFTFCSTNSKTMPKMIAIGFNGKVVFDNGYR